MTLKEGECWTLEHLPERQYQHKDSSFARKLHARHRAINSISRRISNIVQIFRDQVQLSALECNEAAKRLIVLRGTVRAAQQWLRNMHPSNTERLKPGALLRQLEALELQAQEALLLVAVFEQICYCPSLERVEVQLTLRDSMLQVGIKLENCLSQFGTIVSRAAELGMGG